MWWLLLACQNQGETQSPGSRESVCDGLDDDGDGWVDEGAVILVPQLHERDFEGLTRQSVLSLGAYNTLSLLPGVRTVTRTTHPLSTTDAEPSTWERVFDTQGRLVGERLERVQFGDTDFRRVSDGRTVWGLHGPEREEWLVQDWSLDGELLDEQAWSVDTEYTSRGLVASEHHESMGSVAEVDFEYDSQDRLVLSTTRGEGCTQSRHDWDDLAYTRIDWIDEGCTGAWGEDGGVQYDALWFPLYEMGGDLMLEWHEGQLSGAFSTNDTLELQYQDGRLVHTVSTFLSAYDGELWAAYNDAGDLYYLEDKSPQGWTTLTQYEFDGVGGLSGSSRWSERDLTTNQVSYVSDETLNISEVHQDGTLHYEYTFDCHPPQ